MTDGKLVNFCLHAMSGGWPKTSRLQINSTFVWGRASGEWEDSQRGEGLLCFAANIRKATGSQLVIPGYDGKDKNQGDHGHSKSDWLTYLVNKLGLANTLIDLTSGDGFNTKTEFDDYLKLAIRNNWKTNVAVTQQTHALRAMLGVVKSLMNFSLERKFVITPVWPTRFDLRQEIHGSQGQGPFSRLDWIDQEYDRIERYQAQGDLCSLEELASYLRWLHKIIK